MAYTNDLIQQYNALITQAKNLFKEKRGKHSEEEKSYYAAAENICSQLAERYVNQPTESGSWKERAGQCRAMVRRIENELNPPIVIETKKAKTVAAAVPETRTQEFCADLPPEDGRTLTTTETGFSTYNAKPEVPAGMIQSWFKSAPSHDMSDVTGMWDIKKELSFLMDDSLWEKTSEAVHYMREHGIVFYGLPGTGKTFIIEAFISELMKKEYRYIKLLGGDISSSHVGVAEKIIEAAFQEAIDKAPCVIFIDEIDAVCKVRTDSSVKSHEKSLTASFLQAFNKVVSMKEKVLLIAATNHLDQIDPAMVSRLSKTEVKLPETDARREFFEKQFEGIALEEELTCEYMAENTEGCSYRDLDRVSRRVSKELKKIAQASVGVIVEANSFGEGQTYSRALDEAAERNVRSGKVILTREIFDRNNGII